MKEMDIFAMTNHIWKIYEEGKTALMPGVYIVLIRPNNDSRKKEYGIDFMSIDTDGDSDMLYDSYYPDFEIIAYTNITPDENTIEAIARVYEEFQRFIKKRKRGGDRK